MKIKILSGILALGTLLFLPGCAAQNDESESGGPAALRVGVMPAVDAAPIFLAQAEGYFEALGLSVDVQVFTSAQDRQSALQSGTIDGAITDVIALVNNVHNGFSMKVTTATDGMFPFLVREGFEEKTDIKAGMMEVSVTNYLSDRALSKTYRMEKIYINDIPARLEMIAKGTLDMAVIPEPMASQGELSGLKKKFIETGDAFSPDVLVFTEEALRTKEASLRLFHQAYNQGVEAIRKSDVRARELLIEKLKLKEEIRDLIRMPEYHKTLVPDESYLRSVIQWNNTVLKQDVDVSYAQLVDGRFAE